MAISAADLTHLLRRTEFVVHPARYNALRSKSRSAAVDDILRVTEQPRVPASMYATPYEATSEQYDTMTHWWFNRMRTAQRPIQEKMTLFWFSHFTTSYWSVFNARAFARQNTTYRANALGNYRTLCQKMAIEPAMLIYLDNASNSYESPNQNFARELMELFMLGVGNYSENDVVSAALAWAGHSVDWDSYVYKYRPEDHPPLGQTWSMFGKRQHWTGAKMINEMLDNPRLRAISSRFIVKKLWEYFAYIGPSPDLITSLARTFVASGYNIKSLLRAMFNRPEFYSTRAKTGLVRTPIEYVVATMHALNLDAAKLHPNWFMESMAMTPLDPPNVSGWRPNGYWLNTSSFTGRAEFASNSRWLMFERKALDWVAKEPSVAQATRRMCATFGYSPSTPTRRAMEGYLTKIRVTGDAWSQGVGLHVMAMLAPEFHQA